MTISNVLRVAILALLTSLAASGRAEGSSEPSAANPEAQADAWWARYAEGRALLLEERYREAAVVFESLEQIATTVDQKRLASELAMIARALWGEHEALRPDLRRTADELSLLYSSAFIYGFGSSAWLALQTRPDHFAGAVLPFAVLTSASVGGIAVADGYRPFDRGVPHSISAGLYLGFAESVWIVGFQHSRSTRRGGGHWNSARVSTLLWSGATAGAVAGGLIGDTVLPEPGNVSFVTSSAYWGGIVAGLAGAALQPEVDHRGETAFISAGAGYNLGLALGLFLLPRESLSVARIRTTDVVGLGGAMIASGSYVALAGEGANPQIALGAAGLGAAAGLGLGWWLTDGMKAAEPKRRPISNVSVAPLLLPVPGGAALGVMGAM
jgi:hypothetical protein